MARNGFKVIDADTHVYEPIEVLEKYLDSANRAKIEMFKPDLHLVPTPAGLHTCKPGFLRFKRVLGSLNQVEGRAGGNSEKDQFKGTPPSAKTDIDPHERIKDLDMEGVDVNVIIPSSGLAGFSSIPDVGIELAMYQAFHQYMADFCAPYPSRLKSILVFSARDVQGSLTELQRRSKEAWPVAVLPSLPTGTPLDHPMMDPLWAAAQDHDLAIILHQFSFGPPYAPGVADAWDNNFLRRSCGHAWAGMRNAAAILGSGIMDRYPRLRFGILEAGHGWLPSWMGRLDEHADRCSDSIPVLKHRPSESVRGSQYFHSIEISEGEAMTKFTLDVAGEDTMMYASDYPHGESWFPISVDTVVGWKTIPNRMKQKLFWDNAANFYRRITAV